jgi:hypothetical protein
LGALSRFALFGAFFPVAYGQGLWWSGCGLSACGGRLSLVCWCGRLSLVRACGGQGLWLVLVGLFALSLLWSGYSLSRCLGLVRACGVLLWLWRLSLVLVLT